MRGFVLWVPIALFVSLAALFLVQLQRGDDDGRGDFVQSAMVGQPMPDILLPPAVADRPGLQTADLREGSPKLLNVFASWCIPCRAEAPQLAALERQGATIVGVAIRDDPADVAQFLNNYGNPFARIGADERGALQLELGSSGVPETFVIDGTGVIRYQHIGDIRETDVPVLLRELEKAGG